MAALSVAKNKNKRKKQTNSTVFNTDPVIYYGQTVNGAHPGNLAVGLEAILSRQIDHEWQLAEIACKTLEHACSQLHIDGKIIMADHLMVLFGLSAQGRNLQNPPLVIPEHLGRRTLWWGLSKWNQHTSLPLLI